MAVITRNLIDAYLRVFANYENAPEERAEAFWISHKMIFGGTEKELHRNPWAEKMILTLCGHKYVGMSGCTTSGKSTVSGAYGVQMWWAKPRKTKIMVTSTDKQGAKNRIWAHFKEFFIAGAKNRHMPGKLIDSVGSIVLDVEIDGAVSSRSGIELFAGEPKKSADCIAKWVGIHNERVILIMDEMAFLGPQLLSAAYSNLASNPHFQMIGLCNFSSELDPFGVFITPRNGWETIDIDNEEWETVCNGQPGVCLHLDGSKSPNVIAGENIYPDIYSVEMFERHKAMGVNNPRFWSMCRSWKVPVGIGNSIYSESHFHQAYKPEPIWITQPAIISALDPAFTNGGDRSQMTIGKLGFTVGGKMHLHIIHYEELYADASNATVARDYQISRLFRDISKRFGVHPENAAEDATGAGSSFHGITCMEWSNKVVPVVFGGAGSERPSHEGDGRPASEVYYNRAAELWDQGKQYFVKGMISGVTRELAQELCSREYDNLGQQKIKIESKDKMKLRIHRSPDLADSFLILLELARINFGFYPDGEGAIVAKAEQPKGDGGYYDGLASLNEIGTVQKNVREAVQVKPSTTLLGWANDDLQNSDGSDSDGFIDWWSDSSDS